MRIRLTRCAPVVLTLLLLGAGLRSAGAQTGRPAVATDSAAAAGTRDAVVVGTVYDSVARAPLPGALVQLVPESGMGSGISATSDSAGHFRLAAVPPGRYLAGFLHPVLEQLGIESPLTRVHVRRGAARVQELALALPAPRRLGVAHCGAGAAAESVGVLVGLLRDAATGEPLEGGAVTARWTEILSDRRGSTYDTREVTTRSRATGGFVLCGVPVGQAVLAQALHRSAASGVLELALPAGGLLVRDLYVSDTTLVIAAAPPRGASAADSGGRSGEELAPGVRSSRGRTAALRGTVRAQSGTSVEGAHVRLMGSDAEQVTDAEGRYTLMGLPAGTQMVEARALGFTPQRWVVDLRAGQVTAQVLTLAERVSTLAPVRITARELVDFERRRQANLGRYMTREQIEKHPPGTTSNLLIRLGAPVGPDGWFQEVTPARSVVRRDSACVPIVLIDRVRVMFASEMAIDLFAPRPDQIEAVEYYDGFFAQRVIGDFSEHFPVDCGILAIWTRRSFQKPEPVK